MPKWEYQIVIAEKYGKGILGFVMPKEVSWKVHYVNGEQIQNWTEVPLYTYLTKMGEAGWEVITMFSHTIIRTGTLPVEHLYITLKRQKE
ncbi:MAG: hypothetical protein N2053_11180 [Chitinispirillaceae bacterium]|nr:hypothetical protein [Chitinispirillaceae bacterium]